MATDCCSYVQATGKKGYLGLRIKTKDFLIIVDRGEIYAAPPFSVNADDPRFVTVMLGYL